MAVINFNSSFINKYLRKYLKIGNEEVITENMLEDIKYIYLSTTHGYSIAFGKSPLPEVFEFDDCGDEWWCLCMKDTNRFESYKDFIAIDKDDENIYTLKFKEEPEELNCNDKEMEEFNSTVQKFWAEINDYNYLKIDEFGNRGFINANDLKYFKNIEVVRLMDCEIDIHSLGFINELPKLKVLEIGRVLLTDLEGLDKLNTLKRLCIW